MAGPGRHYNFISYCIPFLCLKGPPQICKPSLFLSVSGMPLPLNRWYRCAPPAGGQWYSKIGQ